MPLAAARTAQQAPSPEHRPEHPPPAAAATATHTYSHTHTPLRAEKHSQTVSHTEAEHTTSDGAVSERTTYGAEAATYARIQVVHGKRGPREEIVEYDARTHARITGYSHSSDPRDTREHEAAPQPEPAAAHTPIAIEAHKAAATPTAKVEVAGSPGAMARSTDRTEDAAMDEGRHGERYTRAGDYVSESAEDDEGGDGGEDEGDYDDDDDDDEVDESEGGDAEDGRGRDERRGDEGKQNEGSGWPQGIQQANQSDGEGEEDYYDDDDGEDEDDDRGSADHDSIASGGSVEEEESDHDVDEAVQEEMNGFREDFKGIEKRYRLINKIGEGTFSSVYKAEDLHYDRYENSWDFENGYEEDEVNDHGNSPPPNKRRRFNGHVDGQSHRRRPKYVAIKKIYVTSSPQRIMNELELLHILQGCEDVVPLITAFRHHDQVVAILPYFKHVDFRNYFRSMKIPDIKLYFRSLFRALAHVHKLKIIHRDIKPTNFLYDLARGRGVLVDFGLAEKEGTDTSYCPCQANPGKEKRALNALHAQTISTGYIKNDARPSRRANRAGTRGFRAPEVLFKCTNQTTKIDIWSAGVVLLTMLSKRFPFFNSADDVDATIEIATIFGRVRMKSCALLHGTIFETTLPTIGEKGFTLEKIIMWATNRIAGGGGDSKDVTMPEDEKVACNFLARCLELDPAKRISAKEALEHDFLRMDDDEEEEEEEEEEEGEEDDGQEGEEGEEEYEDGEEDEEEDDDGEADDGQGQYSQAHEADATSGGGVRHD